jgi:hypothetical protein
MQDFDVSIGEQAIMECNQRGSCHISIGRSLEGMLNTSGVLEHFLQNRETAECISQFTMLLRACNRQYQ